MVNTNRLHDVRELRELYCWVFSRIDTRCSKLVFNWFNCVSQCKMQSDGLHYCITVGARRALTQWEERRKLGRSPRREVMAARLARCRLEGRTKAYSRLPCREGWSYKHHLWDMGHYVRSAKSNGSGRSPSRPSRFSISIQRGVDTLKVTLVLTRISSRSNRDLSISRPFPSLYTHPVSEEVRWLT
jgi:hypothetical protein